MLDMVKTLSQTSLPSILAYAGIVFIFLSLGGRLGAQVIADNIPRRQAAVVGIALLLISLGMFVLSTTTQSNDARRSQAELGKRATSEAKEMYRLRPVLPINRPISLMMDIEWRYSGPGKPGECNYSRHREDILTVLGRGADGEPSVAKRKTISDVSKTSCSIPGRDEPEVSTVYGPLVGNELLAHKGQEGIWTLDDVPSATMAQRRAMENDKFVVPLSAFPCEKVPVGRIIVLKDEGLSLELGAAFPGKTEGTIAMKFVHVVKDKEPVAEISESADVWFTMVAPNNDEVRLRMLLNGGVRMPLMETAKLDVVGIGTGTMTLAAKSSPSAAVGGPATFKVMLKEL